MKNTMKIHIENNLYIESDERQYILKQYGKPYTDKKTGELVTPSTNIGYYMTVQQALRGVVQMKVKECTATDLKGLIQHVQSVEEWVKEKVAI